jgi:hypothetical protein
MPVDLDSGSSRTRATNRLKKAVGDVAVRVCVI